MKPGRRAGSMTLFFGLFLVYLSVASGRFVSTDEGKVGDVALALAKGSWGALPVVKYSLGMPLLEAPFVAVALLVSKLARPESQAAVGLALFSLLPALCGAVLGLLTWTLAREVGQRPSRAGLVTLVVALGSPVLVYSTRFFTELPQAVALLGAAIFALRRRDVACGAFLGALFLLKPASGAIALPFFLFLFWRERREAVAFARLLAPVLVGVAMEAGYNQLRFGSPLELGYLQLDKNDRTYGFTGDLWTGLFGQTLSPGAGLFVFMPIIVPALVGVVRLGGRLPSLRALLWGIPLAFLAFHAKWYAWHGGWCWGPRFLVPVIPLLTLGLGELEVESWPSARRIMLGVAVAASIALEVPGLLVSSTDYVQTIFDACGNRFPRESMIDDHPNIHFIPAFSPPMGHTWVAFTRLFGRHWPAPWESQELCPETNVRRLPLEPWWCRAAASGEWPAPLLAALVGIQGIVLLVRWRRSTQAG